jgi:hypothetical protein
MTFRWGYSNAGGMWTSDGERIRCESLRPRAAIRYEGGQQVLNHWQDERTRSRGFTLAFKLTRVISDAHVDGGL